MASSNTDPSPCPKCGAYEWLCSGIGYAYRDGVAPGHPEYGKLYRCPNNPVERDDERRTRLQRLSNLDAFADQTFDTFVVTPAHALAEQIASLQNALAAARRFAHATPRDDIPRWLVLEGSYGTGKTHLAASIGHARLAMGEVVLMLTAPDLLDHLRSSFATDADTPYNQLFDRMRDADLLILDDLGAENASPWAREKLYQLLNHRYTHQLRTVVTTNIDLRALDPRLTSRLQDTRLVTFVSVRAPDHRTSATGPREHAIGQLARLADLTFETFSTTSNIPAERTELTKVLKFAREYADAPQGWLLLLGNSGTGKTHLAAAIALAQQVRGLHPIFVNVIELMDYLRNTFNPSSPTSFEAEFYTIREASFLVLDDLHIGSDSKPWAREKLLQLVMHRYTAQLPTVFTTTQPIPEMARIEPRLVTRLLDKRLARQWALTVRPYYDRQQQATPKAKP